MYKHLKVVLLAILLCPAFCRAQHYEPLQLAQRLLSKDTLNTKEYFKGEFNGHPNGADLSPSVTVSYEELSKRDTTAVVHILLDNSTTGHELDGYLFFAKDTIWKVTAFRALAMTGIIAEVNRELSVLSPRQVDSVIASAHTGKVDKRMFKNKAEYHYLLGNTQLTLASDKELANHFNIHKNQFNLLKNELIAKGILQHGMTNTRNLKDNNIIKQHLKALFIDNAYSDMDAPLNSINFVIGGITDNSVGYLYIKNPKNVPQMSAGNYIMIRSLGNGWYIYKTT